jgi:hypothetical protein
MTITEDEMFNMAKSYIYYLAWEEKYNFNTQTFQQIIIQDYEGNIDWAIEDYLMNVIKKINFYIFLLWLHESIIDYTLLEDVLSQLFIIMQNIVFNCTLNEIKEMIGMDDVCLK